MPPLRRRLLEDLPLRGLAPKTHQCDVAAVRQRAPHSRRPPDQHSEAALRPSLLSLLHDQKVAERTFRLHLYGTRFVSERTLQRPWLLCVLTRPRHSPQLPIVWSPPEVRSLLAAVTRPQAQMCLRMIDACGLRLREGTPLQVADIAPQRRLVRVRQGTGGQDRDVPPAERPLELWRLDWQHERPRPWVFPARHQPTSLSATTLQQTCTHVLRQRGLSSDASHTLCQSYATHVLARGGMARQPSTPRAPTPPDHRSRHASHPSNLRRRACHDQRPDG